MKTAAPQIQPRDGTMQRSYFRCSSQRKQLDLYRNNITDIERDKYIRNHSTTNAPHPPNLFEMGPVAVSARGARFTFVLTFNCQKIFATPIVLYLLAKLNVATARHTRDEHTVVNLLQRRFCRCCPVLPRAAPLMTDGSINKLFYESFLHFMILFAHQCGLVGVWRSIIHNDLLRSLLVILGICSCASQSRNVFVEFLFVEKYPDPIWCRR